MESKIVGEKCEKRICFPLIAKGTGKANSKGLVVLFTNYTEGVVLCKGETNHPLGISMQSWIDFTDRDCWEILDDVTINFKS
jgi:hypothetical protein